MLRSVLAEFEGDRSQLISDKKTGKKHTWDDGKKETLQQNDYVIGLVFQIFVSLQRCLITFRHAPLYATTCNCWCMYHIVFCSEVCVLYELVFCCEACVLYNIVSCCAACVRYAVAKLVFCCEACARRQLRITMI